jgi:hypothetical protein
LSQWVDLDGAGGHFSAEQLRVPRSQTLHLRVDQLIALYWPTVSIQLIRANIPMMLSWTINCLKSTRHFHAALSRNKCRQLRYLLSCPTTVRYSWEQAGRDLAKTLDAAGILYSSCEDGQFIPLDKPPRFMNSKKYTSGSRAVRRTYSMHAPVESWPDIVRYQPSCIWTAKAAHVIDNGVVKTWFRYTFDRKYERAAAKLSTCHTVILP